MNFVQLDWKSLFLVIIISLVRKSRSNPDAKRLYDDLMSNYNRIVRPVINDSSPVTVKLGLKLTQIIDLNLKNQILTTSMWVKQEWWDNKLQWDPGEYGGVETLYVPAEEIWLPDIVLYNNADGSYEITIMTKAIIHYNGRVEWNPPAIYKSYCPIDVQYFPFDTQLCFWKFSSWSYGGYSVSLTISILLSLNFFLLVLIEIIPSTSLTMPLLGKYLVFTMSLVTLSVVVTIVVLNVHFRSPSTHRMPPWVRKVFIHTLPKMLLMRPPQYRFESEDQSAKASKNGNGGYFTGESIDTFATSPSSTRRMNQLRQSISTAVPTPSSPAADDLVINELDSSPGAMDREMNGNLVCYPREIEKAITNAMFIAQHIDNADEYSSVKEDWKYVAMVLDRIFLWIFTSACIIGTAGIFLQAPTLYDSAEPIDVKLSKLSRSFLEGFVDD